MQEMALSFTSWSMSAALSLRSVQSYSLGTYAPNLKSHSWSETFSFFSQRGTAFTVSLCHVLCRHLRPVGPWAQRQVLCCSCARSRKCNTRNRPDPSERHTEMADDLVLTLTQRAGGRPRVDLRLRVGSDLELTLTHRTGGDLELTLTHRDGR